MSWAEILRTSIRFEMLQVMHSSAECQLARCEEEGVAGLVLEGKSRLCSPVGHQVREPTSERTTGR